MIIQCKTPEKPGMLWIAVLPCERRSTVWRPLLDRNTPPLKKRKEKKKGSKLQPLKMIYKGLLLYWKYLALIFTRIFGIRVA